MAANGGSPSPTTSSATSASSLATLALTPGGSNAPPSWWESVTKARSAILSLSSLLPPPASATVSSLADSDRPAISLLSSPAVYGAVSLSLSSSPVSGSGSDPICHWLYDTYLSSDHDLRLIVLSFLPLISSLYLSRLPSPSSPLSGFEAVILAIYSSEVKSRGGKPLLVSVPDLSLASLYHTPPRPAPVSNPRSPRSPTKPKLTPPPSPSVSVLSAPLEPQIAVKSTKRASILAACFDAYYSKISQMPSCSKVDLCEIIANWAGQFCACRFELDEDQQDFDPLNLSSPSSSSSIEIKRSGEEPDISAYPVEDVSKEIGALQIREGDRHCNGEDVGTGTRSRAGSRVPLPWEMLQPLLRILGHCLLAPLNSNEVKDAASAAVRCVYARASHELVPQAILASRSLIQLDKSARNAAKATTSEVGAQSSAAGSTVTTPTTKQRLQEVIMGSK